VRTRGFNDPEGYYLIATYLAKAGAHGEALEMLERSVHDGYGCPAALRHDSFLDDVRDQPAFVQILKQAESASDRAREAFERAGGAAIIASLTP
jgi:hypothetical protein